MSPISRILYVLTLTCLFITSTVLAQTHTGTLFNFVPGLGACGFTNTSVQNVASVSSTFFNSFPGATANPNANPICHHALLISHGGKNLTAQVVDFFTAGFGVNDIGLATTPFQQFGTLDQGIVTGVNWTVL